MGNQLPISLYFEYMKNSIKYHFFGGRKSVPYGHFHTNDYIYEHPDREQMRLFN